MGTFDNSHRLAGLSLSGVRKSFGSLEILHGINLDIDDGEFVVFVGPSGCGKSTLLRLIAGLEETTEGEIMISGRDVTWLTPSDRGVAMVFQNYALYPHMSVAENMGFALKVAKHPKSEIERKIAQTADILQLTPFLDRKPSQLSGGQRQRVAIGRAIVRDPDVFLFDEPLSNLDAELRVDMRIEIAKLHKELGNTMIYVTHDQTEAMTLADKIVVLRAGQVEQVGTPDILYEDPDNVFVAGFIGSPRMNFLKGTFDGAGNVVIAGHKLPAPDLHSQQEAGAPVTVGIRPEHLRPAQKNEPSLPFKIDFSEYLGGISYAHGSMPDGMTFTMEARRDWTARAGDQISVTADTSDLRLFDQDGLRMR